MSMQTRNYLQERLLEGVTSATMPAASRQGIRGCIPLSRASEPAKPVTGAHATATEPQSTKCAHAPLLFITSAARDAALSPSRDLQAGACVFLLAVSFASFRWLRVLVRAQGNLRSGIGRPGAWRFSCVGDKCLSLFEKKFISRKLEL